MKSLDIAFMLTLWYDILERFNATSMTLQNKCAHLTTATKLLRSLKLMVDSFRDMFDQFQERAGKLSPHVNEQFNCEVSRKRKRKLAGDETREGEVELHGPQEYKINEFLPIIDKLRICLEYRLSAYTAIEEKFEFLLKFKSLNSDEIAAAAGNLLNAYKTDLDENFGKEMIQFKEFIDGIETPSPLEALETIKGNKLESLLPNVYVAYRIYLTLPISNCSAERAFSKLARVKNDLRSSMTDERLNALSLLTIERDILRNMSFEELIKDFAANKARKKPF